MTCKICKFGGTSISNDERCQYALNIDLRIDPPMFDVPGSNTHKVASWLMHEKAPKVEMPESLKKRIEKMKKEGLIND